MCGQRYVPRNKSQIRIRQLVPDEVAGAMLLQMLIKHPDYAPRFVLVPLDGCGQLDRVVYVGMGVLEVHALPIVRALSGHLEVEPALQLVFLGEGVVCELALLVVRLDEVFDYGARLQSVSVPTNAAS